MNNMGVICATSDMNLVDAAFREGAKVIFIGDAMEMPKGYNFINGIIFTPDYQTMCSIIENDQLNFSMRYRQLLASPNCEEMFAVIIAALFKGTNIMLYFPPDTIQLKYPALLIKYMLDIFGISVADGNMPFMYNPMYNPINMRLLYLYNLANWEEFLMSTEVLDEFTLNKLRTEIIPIYKISPDISDKDLIEKIEIIKFYLAARIAARGTGSRRLFSKEK